MDEEEVPILPGPKMEDMEEVSAAPEEPPVELPPLLEPAQRKVPRVRRTRERLDVSHIAPVAVSEPVRSVLDEAPKKASKKVIKCPMCMFRIPVESDERPLVLECPKCGTKGKLK
jgi:DNA-directed RNA polymerase subunit RPC12/RpoP